MIPTWRIPIIVWCLGMGLLPLAAGAHVMATGSLSWR